MSPILNKIAVIAGMIAFTSSSGNGSSPVPDNAVTLTCPPMQYFADPDFEVEVSRYQTEPTRFRYTYSIAFGEGSRTRPLSKIRIEDIAEADLEGWTGDFRSCRMSGASKGRQALVCRAKLIPSEKRQTNRGATVILTSSRAPGVSRYTATTVVTPKDALLTPENKAAWLPLFDHNEALLTEAVYDAAMQQCSSAAILEDEERAMTGAVTAPFDAGKTVSAAKVSSAKPDGLGSALARVIDETGAQERASSRIALTDSAGRWIVSGAESNIDWSSLYHGPAHSAAKVDLDQVTSACNVRAVFVEVLPADPPAGTDTKSPTPEAATVLRHMPLERRAVQITPSGPCRPLDESFKLYLPDYERRR